ncbi:hypothetical protein [uncultured Tateyamaria sp.]|uniref:hypothetical protein n=1 Tax=Tateyamaria sp. 1078 TaxID=3417464 RepID=UPI00263698A1|nr:hypothetical protein [uncultured Tateyamaria sp.]
MSGALADMMNSEFAHGEPVYDVVWLSNLDAWEWYSIPGPDLFRHAEGFGIPERDVQAVEIDGVWHIRLSEPLAHGYGVYRRACDG